MFSVCSLLPSQPLLALPLLIQNGWVFSWIEIPFYMILIQYIALLFMYLF